MNKAEKIELLRRIQTGELKASDLPKPLPERNYVKQIDGLFKCIETGETITIEEIERQRGKLPKQIDLFKYECTYESGEVVSIKRNAISRLEQMETFEQDEFLELMKEASKT